MIRATHGTNLQRLIIGNKDQKEAHTDFITFWVNKEILNLLSGTQSTNNIDVVMLYWFF